MAAAAARSREQENTVPPDVPAPKLALFEGRDHVVKMEFFRKDSSLSNEVFESLDMPIGGGIGVDDLGHPETVVEETSAVTSPVLEQAEGLGDQVSDVEAERGRPVCSLPVNTGMWMITLIYAVSQKNTWLIF